MVLHIWVNHEKEQVYAEAEPLLQGRRPDLWVQWLSTSRVHTAKEKNIPKVVAKVGPLEDGSWVLGPDIYINSNGQAIQYNRVNLAAEMVCGTTLYLPGDSSPSWTSSLPDTSDYVSSLRTDMQTIRSPPPHLPCKTAKSLMVYRLLPMFSYVMMLSVNPYYGLYWVIKRTDNYNRHQQL